MVQEYFPFDSGAGAAITETQWRRMARLFVGTGVEAGLAVTVGSGATVNLAAGSAWIDGHYYRTDATVAVEFTPNVLATPQTVYVVLELDPTANVVTPKCITTSPSVNPVGVYQFLLCTFVLPPQGQTQTATQLVDRRHYPGLQAITHTGSATVNGVSGSAVIDFTGHYELPVGRKVRVDFDAMITNAQFTSGNTGSGALFYSLNGAAWAQLVASTWSPPLHDYAITSHVGGFEIFPAQSVPSRLAFRAQFTARAPASNSVTRMDNPRVAIRPIGF